MLELLESRRSVRSYSPESIGPELVDRLKSEVTFINSHEAGLNFQLFFNDSSPFDGFTRSYGMFRNVRNYLCAVVDPSFADAYERAGYFAQQFVIEALKSGIGTCFVGGTFSRDNIKARVEVYEKVPFVVTLGFAEIEKTTFIGKFAAKIAHRKRKSLRDFFQGTDQEYQEAISRFDWLETALRAVSCAPSALNSQPVRLSVRNIEGELRLVAMTVDPKKYAIELGIAKYNVAAAVGGVWDWGESAQFYKD